MLDFYSDIFAISFLAHPYKKYIKNVSRGEDSNLRRENPTDLQSVAIGHSATSGNNEIITRNNHNL